jgi:hypothetical protein
VVLPYSGASESAIRARGRNLKQTFQTTRYWDFDFSMMAHSSNNSAAFPSEQAQLLQDIARDGNANEYGYGGQANGTTSKF